MSRFEATSCSQCGRDLGPGDAGVSHCADHTSPFQSALLRKLALVDDHLQQVQHYGHSRDLRDAMSTVAALLEALQDMVLGDAEAIEEADQFGVPFPPEMLSSYNKARAAIAKATGSAA